jgi:hypothetical protein
VELDFACGGLLREVGGDIAQSECHGFSPCEVTGLRLARMHQEPVIVSEEPMPPNEVLLMSSCPRGIGRPAFAKAN